MCRFGRKSAAHACTAKELTSQTSQDCQLTNRISEAGKLIEQETLFSGYRIESNSNNEICLEIHLEALLRVLKSCETCSVSAKITCFWYRADVIVPSALDPQLHRGELSDAEVTLKLNRRQSDNAPIWAFEIRGRVSCLFLFFGTRAEPQSAHDKPVSISHEVKVHILSARRQAELNEPLCPPPDVSQLCGA